MPAPAWTSAEKQIIRGGWTTGRPAEDMLRDIHALGVHDRTPAAMTAQADRLGLKRPKWFLDQIRERGRQAQKARKSGKTYWSDTATRRLVRLANLHGPTGAAHIMGVTVKQAEGRLHRIGWRRNNPKELVKAAAEIDTYSPTVHAADRMAALMERAREMGVC